MVILGAGASYDSVFEIFNQEEEAKWRPPLGADLFEPRKNFREIFDKYEGLQTLYSALNAVDDIEEYFQERWDFAINNNANELLNSLINIQYALNDLMLNISIKYKNIGLSNYDILINDAYEYSKKHKEPVLFVTFNYDILLEYSIRKRYPGALDYLQIHEYLMYPLKIIKPHGSCNWFREFKTDMSFGSGYAHYNDLYRQMLPLNGIESHLNKDIFVALSSLLINRDRWGNPEYSKLYPQLLIPFKSKDTFILPRSQKEYLEENMENVDSILIIGWKGYEETFLKLMKEKIGQKKVKIQSINIGDKIVEERLKQYLPNAEFYHFTEGLNLTKFYSRSMDWDASDSFFYQIADGSFSAYSLRVIKKHQESFFKKEA